MGRHVLDLAESMSSMGHDVLLIYAPARAEHGFAERVQARDQYGYKAVPIEMSRAPGPRDSVSMAALRRAVKSFGRVDILHGHSSKGGALARLARWGIADHVVYTPNAWYTLNPELGAASRFMYKVVELSLASITDRIIVVSDEERAHAVELGIDSSKLALVENGIDLSTDATIAEARRRSRRRFGIPEAGTVIGFLGRLASQKAPDLAVRVFRAIRQQRPDLVCVLAGNGPERNHLDSLSREIGMRESIVWIPDAVGRELIPAFDVFLMTSRYEGFPYTMVEALDAACAIVTTEVGGARACVLDQTNGYVVPTRGADVLAAAVLQVVESRQKCDDMRRASRRMATTFSRERMAERTLAVYESILVAHN